MAAYSFSWKIALLVAVVMLVVVVFYRQNVHACPSGGRLRGASVKLGPKTGVTVASALLVHYVLTVAVSIFSFAGSLRECRRPLAISALLCFADCIPWMLRSAHHWSV